MGPSLIFLSAGLSLLAAARAFWFIRSSRLRGGWILVLAALVLLGAWRFVAGLEQVRAGGAVPASEWMSLGVFLLLLGGVLWLTGCFRDRAQDADSRERTEPKRDEPRTGHPVIPLGGPEAQRPAEELARFLETVVDTADVWINTLDLQTRVVLWNHTAERISGYGREEVQGRADIWERLYPDEAYRTEIGRKVSAILQKDEVVRDLETSIRTKQGDTRIISWSSRSLMDAQGMISGSLAIGRDVTEFRRVEENLQRVHAMQNLILEHNVLGIAYVQDRRIVWANPRAAAMLGIPLEQFVGAPSRIIYPDDATYEEIGRRAYSAMAQGGVSDNRIQMRRTNGQYFWCRLVGMAVDASKPHAGSVWLAEDISKQVAAEAALAESEARFRGAFEGTQDAILLLTLDGIFDCNQRALQLFGFAHKSEMLRLHPADLSPVRQPDGLDSRAEAMKHIQTAFREGSAQFQWEHRSQSGRVFTSDVLLSTFQMGRRKVVQACVRDIGERLAAEAKARESEGRFRMLFEQYADAVLLQDSRSGRYLDVNQAALDMLRCSREELDQLGTMDLSPEFQPDGRTSLEKGKEMMRMALRKGSHRFRWVHNSPHRDDFTVDVLLTVIQPGVSPLVFSTWREVPSGENS